MRKRSDRSIVEAFVKRLQKQISVNAAFIFGSRARGTYFADSDYDVLIVSKDFEGLSLYERNKILADAWDWSYYADLIGLTPEEYRKQKKISIGFRSMIRGSIKVW